MKVKNIWMVVALLAMATVAHAGVVANYDFESPTQLDSIDTDADTTASDYTYQRGGLWSTSHYVTGSDTAGSTSTLGAALANGDYDEFSISVAAGKTMDLQSLVFDHTGIATPDWVAFKAYVLIDDDYNGFTSADYLTNTHLQDDAGEVGFTVDLSTGPYEIADVAGGTSIDFRIYYADGSTSADRAHRMDNVVVNANVIPEPATLGLFGLAGGAMLFIRRKIMM